MWCWAVLFNMSYNLFFMVTLEVGNYSYLTREREKHGEIKQPFQSKPELVAGRTSVQTSHT